MDTKSILAQIEADAQEAVDDVLKEVENQVLSIHEQSDLRLSELKDTTLREAKAEPADGRAYAAPGGIERAG